MDEEANLANPAEVSNILVRPICPAPDTNRAVTSSSSSASFTSSPPDFLRNVQAAFKRHRRLGMQLNNLRPSRMMFPDHNIFRSSDLSSTDIHHAKISPDFGTSNKADSLKDSNSSSEDMVSPESELDASSDLPSVSGYNAVLEGMNKQLNAIEHQNKPPKEVQSSLAKFSGFDDQTPSKMDYLSSHLSSLLLTEIELDAANPSLFYSDIGHNLKLSEVGSDVRATSSLQKRIDQVEDKQKHSRALLQGKSNQPMTQGSVIGSSCTTTLINSASAPMISSNTSCRDFDLRHEPLSRVDILRPPSTSGKDMHGAQAQAHPPVVSSKENLCRMDEINAPKGHSIQDERSTKEKEHACDPMVDPYRHEKQEKPAGLKGTSSKSKKNYDPDLFFKVNGKLYQRLGKIGSGGSSEVHKVISSDCTIFALKKIKLRGRDYATAFGFCQEIEYLNKLKGKSNIIQLIDYEVTDKALLQEVMSGTMSNKDGRLKEDGYIYMVLEYGEIDLAHMLSQKWKEMDGCDQKIDENWLRFYWQQILLAVNTIHEERIVHSDLKPANFLLVKGSLKLIDFGIAKAILSDTTNIQRDAQVGTLSYMSPEAFMCNESDSNGKTIKCGRPSDIWSLGCILYQMVYGKTPFSEYKTFWAKFKVITDQNHEIVYGSVSNPLLLDLMKKCLAWDRNERWRIPQLLQHPFLVPPVPPRESLLLQLVADGCAGNHEAWQLYLQLRKLLVETDTDRRAPSESVCCKLLSEISSVCAQLQSHFSE